LSGAALLQDNKTTALDKQRRAPIRLTAPYLALTGLVGAYFVPGNKGGK